MTRYYTVDEPKYVLCYSLTNGTMNLVYLVPNEQLSTDEPDVEFYETQLEALYRIIDLGFVLIGKIDMKPPFSLEESIVDEEEMTFLFIGEYKFLLFSTINECQDKVNEINSCLDNTYVTSTITMTNYDDDTLEGYIILVDDVIKSCLTPTQINQIMTTDSSGVKLSI